MALDASRVQRPLGTSVRLARYASRVLSGWALQLFAYLWLAVLFIEARFRPPPKHADTRILVIAIGGLGDSLLLDSLFRRLREQWPNARIDVLSACFDEMWRRMASVDNVIFFRLLTAKTARTYAALFRQIYRSGYDIAVEGLAMLPDHGTWHVLPAVVLDASRAPIRIGQHDTGKLHWLAGDAQVSAERVRRLERARKLPRVPRNRHLTHVVPLPPTTLTLLNPEGVLAALGLPYHRKPNEPVLLGEPELDQWAHTLLRRRWVTTDDVIAGLVLDVTYELKRWPVERFAELVRRGSNDGIRFVVVGRETRHSKLFSHFGSDQVMDLTGITNLGQLLSIIRECDLFIGSDSGPAQIAQAFGVPTVVLFGPSNDREYGPPHDSVHRIVTPPIELPCRPCIMGPCVMQQSCMHLITVEQVHAEVQRLIAALRPRKPRPTEPPPGAAGDCRLRLGELGILCDL